MSELAWPEPDVDTAEPRKRRNSLLYYNPRSRDIKFDCGWSSRGTEDDKEMPAVLEARKIMRTLSTDDLGPSGLSLGVQNQVLAFLEATTTEASTFPSIVPDDEGVAVLHWVAGQRSLQVDVEESGPTYLWAKEPGHDSVVLTEPGAITLCAKIHVRRIADDVMAINPTWRERMRRL